LFRYDQELVGQYQATQLSTPFGSCLYKADEIVKIVNSEGHTYPRYALPLALGKISRELWEERIANYTADTLCLQLSRQEEPS